MKKIWKYLCFGTCLGLLAACTPNYPELSEKGLPQASELNVVIDVDQATNYVTFSVTNPGVVPVWIFGSEQLIDGKQNKNYAYTGNGVKLRIREEGEHSVEVKAYNANGISVGSLLKTFTLNETYRDPFDPSPYMRALSGGSSQNWVWNSTENNHFGCGPVGNPLGWWQCPAGGKEGFLYDDVMTFDNEGNYTYNPGDGQAYAKGDAEYPAGHAIESDDYLFPAEEKTTHYTFENEWNEAGIEEVYLVLDPGSILSYVAHKSIVDNPRYYVMESSTASMKNKLQLMSTVYTPNNSEGISYYYEFVPEGSGDDQPEDDTIYDVDGPGNLWKSATITSELWYSGADWAGGLTPDFAITEGNGFTVTIPDGIGGSEWQGQTKLKSGIASSSDKEYDLSVTLVADADMTVTIKLTNFPEEEGDIHAFFYDGNIELHKGEAFTYQRHNLTQPVSGDNVMLIFDFGRSPVGSTITVSDVCFQEHLSSSADIDVDSDDNLWKSATITPELWYSGGDWAGGLTPEFEITAGNGFTVTIPDGIGGSEWQGQTKLKSGIATSSAKYYDLSVTILADADMTATIKLTNFPEEDGDIHAFFYDGNIALFKGEKRTYTRTVLRQPVSGDNLMLIFDFGRSPVGSKITVSDICFQEHKSVSPVVYDITGESNLWLKKEYTMTFYTAHGSDWAGLPDSGFEADDANNVYHVTMPEATDSQWQRQVAFHTTMSSSAAKKYDFCCTVTPTAYLPGVTFKLVLDGGGDNDSIFYFEDRIGLEAGEAFVFQKPNMPGIDMDRISLFFDFGGNPEGAEVEIKDICFQEHK